MDFHNLNRALTGNMLKVPPVSLAGLIPVALPTGEANAQSGLERRVEHVLTSTPVLDRRNDLPWALRNSYRNNAFDINLMMDGGQLGMSLRTDISNLRPGRVGGQVWSGWRPADIKSPEAISSKALKQSTKDSSTSI